MKDKNNSDKNLKTKNHETENYVCIRPGMLYAFFSSAKQICIGSVKEYSPKKPVCVKKAPVKIKKIVATNPRPFHFYLFNI